MRSVTICDLDPTGTRLAFDLYDLLQVIGPKATGSWWLGHAVELNEFMPGPVPDLEGWRDGRSLLESSRGMQVISGLFEGSIAQGTSAWIRIRAVDSSCFEVQTGDEDVLKAISRHFRQTHQTPGDAGGAG